MSTDDHKPDGPKNALLVAGLSLGAPVAMVFMAALLPKDDRPLHPADNRWYCYLTVIACFGSALSAGWAITHRPKSPGPVLAIATLGILASALIGFVAIFLASIHGMHT